MLQKFRIISVRSHIVGTTVSELICEINKLTCVVTFTDLSAAAWICKLKLLADILELENCAFARANHIIVTVSCRVTAFFNRVEGRLELKHLIERINSQQIV